MRRRVVLAVGVVSVTVRFAAVTCPPSPLGKDKELSAVSRGGRRNAKQRRDTPARAATSGFADPVLVCVVWLEQKVGGRRWRHVQQSRQTNWAGVRVRGGSEAPSACCRVDQTPALVCTSAAGISADIAAVFCWINIGIHTRSVCCSTTQSPGGIVVDPALGGDWGRGRSAGKERQTSCRGWKIGR